MAGLSAQKIVVLVALGGCQALVFTSPLPLLLVVIAETHLLGVVRERKANDQRRIQLGDGASLSIHQGNVQYTTDQDL